MQPRREAQLELARCLKHLRNVDAQLTAALRDVPPWEHLPHELQTAATHIAAALPRLVAARDELNSLATRERE